MQAQDRLLLESVETFFELCADKEPSAGAFSISVTHGSPRQPQGQWQVFWSGATPGGVDMDYRCRPGRRHMLMHGRLAMHVDLTAARATITVKGDDASALQEALAVLLCEVMAQRGQFVIHGACLADQAGRAVLIAAPSGTGKTTTAIALASSGMSLMGDDISFVRAAGQSFDVWGVARRRLRVRSGTLDLLPELRLLPAQAAGNQRDAMIELPLPVRKKSARLAAVLLLEGWAPEHILTPLAPLDALSRLVRQNVRAFDTSRNGPAGAAFAAMASLVQAVPVAAARLGRNLRDLHAIVEPLMTGQAANAQ